MATLRRRRGMVFYVDAAPVREVVRKLVEERGFSQQEVARASGTSQAWVNAMVRGTYSRGKPVRRVTSQAALGVLSVQGRALAPAQLIDSALYYYMIDSYLACGLTVAEVSEACGLSSDLVSRVGRGRLIRAETLGRLLDHVSELDEMRCRRALARGDRKKEA